MSTVLVTSISGGTICGWTFNRDDEGHRTYKAKYKVLHAVTDGPYTVLQCPGLPSPGSTWEFGNETDEWAYCLATATITATVTEGNNLISIVEVTFSTKPVDPSKQRCQNTEVGNPLTEPYKISGKYNKYTEEITQDRFGNQITNSAFELFRGPHVEFDFNRQSIRIEMNVYPLPVGVFGPMIDCVNDAPLWGLPARCWKLGPPTWERCFYGNCQIYFKLTYEFESNTRTNPVSGEVTSGFDRDLADEATKALNGHWGTVGNLTQWVLDPINQDGTMPSYDNPGHFCRVLDRQGNPMKVMLNGAGIPVGTQPNPGTETNLFTGTLDLASVQAALPHNIVLTGQPPAPSQLYFHFEEISFNPSVLLDYALLVIEGLDDKGTPVTEQLLVYGVNNGPPAITHTQYTYSQVNSVVIETVTTPTGAPLSTGACVLDSVASFGEALTTLATIHVEHYEYANFLLLGIPTDFN